MRLLPRLAMSSWAESSASHCQFIINVFPAPSHTSFLLSCILVFWERAHTPRPSVGQGQVPKRAAATPGLGVHTSTAWHWLRRWRLCWFDSWTQSCPGLRNQAFLFTVFFFFPKEYVVFPDVKHVPALEVACTPTIEMAAGSVQATLFAGPSSGKQEGTARTHTVPRQILDPKCLCAERSPFPLPYYPM